MGAGNSSIATNEVNKSISSTITSVLQSQIDASSKALCSNAIHIENVSGCKMQFDGQTCDASVISSMMADTNFTEKTSQSVFDQTKQMSDALTDPGFGSFGNSSRSSNIQNLNVAVAKDVEMSMKTDCSVEARAINEIVVRNVTCTPGDSVDFKFGKQAVTVKMVADCVAKHGASTQAMQDLSTMTDQTAKATTKGGGLWDLIILLLMAPLLTFLMPLALRKGFTSFKDKDTSPLHTVAIVLSICLGICFVGWWPGYGAFQLGIAPWPYPYSEKDLSNGKQVCKDGVFDRTTVVNEFMFYDPNCFLYNQVNATTGPNCPDSEKEIHYKTCGLFSGKCKSAELDAEIARFKKVSKLCAEMPPLKGVQFCTEDNLAAIMFRDEYPTCKKLRAGVFVNEKVDTSGTVNVNPDVFLAAGEKFMEGVQDPIKVRCNGRPNCIDLEVTADDPDGTAKFLQSSPDDCLDPDYQTKKGLFILAKKKCKELNDTVPEVIRNTSEEGGLRHSYQEQCALSPTMYFTKCSGNRCTYQTDSTDVEVQRACRNDYTDCQDPEYLQDAGYVETMATLCKKRYDDWQGRHISFLQVTVAVYLIIVICIVALFIIGNKKRQQQRQMFDDMEARGEYTGRRHYGAGNMLGIPDSNIPPFTSKIVGQTGIFWGVLLFLFLAWATVGVPFGKLGAALEMAPLYNRSDDGEEAPFIRNLEDWDANQQKINGAIWTGVLTLLIIIWIVMHISARSRYKMFFDAQKQQPNL